MNSWTPEAPWTRPTRSPPSGLLSAQDYTPFEEMELGGWPVRTILRGRTVFADGEPIGAYLKRSLGAEQSLAAS